VGLVTFRKSSRVHGICDKHQHWNSLINQTLTFWQKVPVWIFEILIPWQVCLLTDKYVFQWALMTLLDPSRAVENLIYIGYSGDPSAAVRLTRRRRLDRKKKQSDRNVFHCFVFGPKKSGKSALVNSFIGRFISIHLKETYINYVCLCLYSSW
jgi:hypothetical protein